MQPPNPPPTPSENPNRRYYRRVVHISAEDSPNVRRALEQIARGEEPDNETVIPGVIKYEDGQKGYKYRREYWDPVRQCIGLDGRFWKGKDQLLFPPHWLDRAHLIDMMLRESGIRRQARSIGIDVGEGMADTSMCAIDEHGIIELLSRPTPDTNVIPGEALWFMNKHDVAPEMVFFDRGGGGKQHADRLRADGYAVNTVDFGGTIILEPRRGLRLISERKENLEEKSVYKDRRAQMFFTFSQLLDPKGLVIETDWGNIGGEKGFGIPGEYIELRQELAPIPRLIAEEGKFYIPPKNRKPGQKETTSKTLVELIGRSPDRADAAALAIFGFIYEVTFHIAGAV